MRRSQDPGHGVNVFLVEAWDGPVLHGHAEGETHGSCCQRHTYMRANRAHRADALLGARQLFGLVFREKIYGSRRQTRCLGENYPAGRDHRGWFVTNKIVGPATFERQPPQDQLYHTISPGFPGEKGTREPVDR